MDPGPVAARRPRMTVLCCFRTLRERMRPPLLSPLFASATTLTGVGPKVDKLLGRVTGRENGARIADLLFHLPSGAIDRRARPKLRAVEPGTAATAAVPIDRHPPSPPRRP